MTNCSHSQRGRVRVAEPGQRRGDELVSGDLPSLRRALAVERPAVDALRAAEIVPSHLGEPLVDERGLAHSAPRDEGEDVDGGILPCGVEFFESVFAAEEGRVSGGEFGEGDLQDFRSLGDFGNLGISSDQIFLE